MSVVRETLINKIVLAVAGSTIVGGGTVVLRSAQTNAVQSQEISQLRDEQKRTETAVDRLVETTQQLDKSVAVLNERLK